MCTVACPQGCPHPRAFDRGARPSWRGSTVWARPKVPIVGLMRQESTILSAPAMLIRARKGMHHGRTRGVRAPCGHATVHTVEYSGAGRHAELRSAAESTGGHCRRSPTDRLMAQDCRVLIESPPSVHCGDLEGPGVATRRRARPEDRLGDPGRTPRRRGMRWSTWDGSRFGRAVPVDPPPPDPVAS